MKLVIVESPTKAKTISKFLGGDYTVLSSFGHVRDLPKSELGVDTTTFTPRYVIPRASQKKVTALKKAAAKTDAIILATDEDREGEAIAWHIVQALGLHTRSEKSEFNPNAPKETPPNLPFARGGEGEGLRGSDHSDAFVDSDRVQRIVFHEITEEAIAEALKNPRAIDQKLVDAQQARRVLDRFVGYELSPLLWKKVARGLSAGRVQSVALRFVVERERERQAFQKQEYWTIEANYVKDSTPFSGKLYARDGKPLEKFAVPNEAEAKRIVASLADRPHTVIAIVKKELTRTPSPPFTTSTLQQTANMVLGFSAKQTMMLAQGLYENGFITYMRTDSVHLAEKFVRETGAFVRTTYGERYTLPAPRAYTTKSKGAQEAHEAIRPTAPETTPELLRQSLDARAGKLYDLIWRRAIATQMATATIAATSATLTVDPYTFRAAGSIILFDGFLTVAGYHGKEKVLPALAEGEIFTPTAITPLQHTTEPPARYSDATLVKALEEHGIGRPSTYAPTIATLIERNYVARDERKKLQPSDIAFVVNDLLKEHFPSIVDYQFTAQMEGELDAIAEGRRPWQEVLALFYHPFHEQVQKKYEEISKKETTEQATDIVCEKCGKPMVAKIGRFGKFLACTGFPECRNTRPLDANGAPAPLLETSEKCEKCGKPMVVKEGRFGRFLSCSDYPTCKTTKPIAAGTGVTCPTCGKGEVVARRSKRGRTFYGCNQYPACKTVFWSRPTGEKCPTCGSLLVAGKSDTIVCPNKACNNPPEGSKM